MVVVATDEAGNESSQTVTVDVTDFDEINPVITGPSGEAGDATSTASIEENTTAVHGFTADETVTWSLGESADKDKFAIDETGALSFVEAPDYETPGSAAESNAYSVVVVATDEVGNESSQTVTVDVTDVDDFNPVITGPSGEAGDATSTASIVENTTAVYGFTADEKVTWSLGESADKDKFAIDETGALSFVEAPDYETPGSAAESNAYSVVVVATDEVGNESSQTVTVDVTDVDDFNPVITGPSGEAGDATSTASIEENTTAVYGFTADETVTWSLGESADKDKFAIDETGALSFVEAPDYETPGSAAESNAYSVVVVATDEAGNESSQTVTVDVTDVDDFNPVITGPSGEAGDATSTASIVENTTAVYGFTADETVTWSLGESADKDKFAIDKTGALSFAEAPDFEAKASAAKDNSYSVVVVATDEAGNESSQTVTVDVTDFDEINPAITGPSGEAGDATSTASIVENTTAVHGFTADEAVTWSLGESADKDKFAIDETGALSFLEAPDYETPGSAEESNAYSVVVVATDEVGNESSQIVTVDVTDFDEIPPIIARSDGDKVLFEEIEDTGILTKAIKEERRK